MPRELPPFAMVSDTELRSLWAQHSDPDVRRLILEVVRYRRLVKEIDSLYTATHTAWRECVGGDLVALHRLLQVMTIERQRIP